MRTSAYIRHGSSVDVCRRSSDGGIDVCNSHGVAVLLWDYFAVRERTFQGFLLGSTSHKSSFLMGQGGIAGTALGDKYVLSKHTCRTYRNKHTVGL